MRLLYVEDERLIRESVAKQIQKMFPLEVFTACQYFFSEIIQPGIAVSKHQYALFHPPSFLLQLFVSEP